MRVMISKKFITACTAALVLALCVSLIALASCAPKAYAAESGVPDDDAFYVISCDPQETLPAAIKYPAVYVQFSKPVVALTALGEAGDSSLYMKITPPLKGVYRWYGTSLLAFESSEEIIPQHEYTVEVPANVTSISGEKITGERVFKFRTEELRMLSVIPGWDAASRGEYIDSSDVPPKDAVSIGIVFSYPVNKNVVTDYLTVTDSQGDKYAYSTELSAPATLVLTLKKTPPENTSLTVLLETGARSEKNFAGRLTSQEMGFSTLRRFSLSRVITDARSTGELRNPVYFYFSHRLDEKTAAQIVSAVHTEPAMPVDASNIVVRGSQLIVQGLPVSYNDDYSISIDTSVIKDVNGRVYDRAIGPEAVHVPEAASFASFKDYGIGILEAQFDPKLAMLYQNIEPNSKYSVSSLSGKGSKQFDLNPESIPRNMQIVEGVDLKPFLVSNGPRSVGAVNFMAEINYKQKNWEGEYRVYKSTNRQLVQVTDLGVTARYAYNKVIVLVTRLSTGEPVPGAEIFIHRPGSGETQTERLSALLSNPGGTDGQNFIGQTNREGFLSYNLPPRYFVSGNYFFIEARDGVDRVIFSPDTYSLWRFGVYNYESPANAERTSMQTFIFTDRGLYKPGETMTYRGIDRNLTLGKYSPFTGAYKISIRENVWRAPELFSDSGTTSESGGFWGRWKVPADLEPGGYVINYTRYADGREYSKNEYFTVAYFERLRFESSVSIPNDIAYIRGDRLSAALSASYLGGGSLAGASWQADWYREPAWFSPAKIFSTQLKNYTFGPVTGYDYRSTLGSESGVISDDGKGSTSQLTGEELLKGKPYFYRVETTVFDQGGQAISAMSSAIVHPARYYIGLSAAKGKRGFAKKGEKLEFDFTIVSPNASLSSAANESANVLPESLPAKKSAKVELLREEWMRVQQMGVNGTLNTRWEKKQILEVEQSVSYNAPKTLGDAAGNFSITPPKGGYYILRVSASDSRGNDVVTERGFYVTGSDWGYYSSNAQEINLVPDKQLYTVGETAEIILQSPLPKGRYLITIEREGIFSEELITLNESASVITVPVKEEYLPIVYVSVSSFSVRSKTPEHDYWTPDTDKPSGYFGLTTLHVDAKDKKFDIEVISDKTLYKPGETATLTIKAAKNGAPLSGAEITLMAVDRGVIDLINYHVPDPVSFFYAEHRFFNAVRGGDSRAYLIDPVTYEIKSLTGGDEDGKLNERSNFDPTAFFEPYITTDSNGTATVSFTLPDTLTSYRITAVGVKNDLFALSENEVSVNNPVSVREVLPRRLRVGDVSEAGAVISNLGAENEDVTIKLEIVPGTDRAKSLESEDGVVRQNGALLVRDSAEKTISAPGGKTVPLMFNIEAVTPGFVTLVYTVRSKSVNERIIRVFEIDKPYMFETVTTVGEVQNSSAQEIIVIPAENGNTGQVYIQLDPTRLGTLTEAVNYVFRYPYGCVEQTASQLLPLVYFGDYIDIFGLNSEVSSPRRLTESKLREIGKLQKSDGGFPYWPTSSESHLFPSLKVAELIAAAEGNGWNIPASINKTTLINYFQNELDRRGVGVYSTAYIQWIIARLGGDVSKRAADKILNDKNAGLAEMTYVALAYVESGDIKSAEDIQKQLRRFILPGTREVDITDPADYYRNWYFSPNKSEDLALLLTLYAKLSVDDPLCVRLLTTLLQHQKAHNGYWYNTAVTARVLSSVAEWIRAKNLTSINYTAEAAIGSLNVIAAQFEGASGKFGAPKTMPKPVEKIIPFSELLSKGITRGAETPVTFSKDGTGSVFYTLSMKYEIPAMEQLPRDEGIGVFMEVRDAVTGKIITDGVLQSGKLYQAKVTVSTTRDRTFAALRVPIPAGAEVLNAAFATTGRLFTPAEEEDNDDSRRWYLSSQRIYDTEVQYFWDYFPKGRQQVDFLFRAVRLGAYQTPAALAECMYAGEIFGRWKGAVWEIK